MPCNINPGEKSKNVEVLQQFLRDNSLYKFAIDGKYGFYTRKTVRAWQRSHGLGQDGWAGCVTTTKMKLACANHNCNKPAKPVKPVEPVKPVKPPAPIIPPSGASHQITFHLNPPNGPNNFIVIELNYYQDLDDYVSGGQLTLPLDHNIYQKFKINALFELKWTWKGARAVKIMNGYITNLKRSGSKLEITFKDKGSLLEKKNYLKYKNVRRSHIVSDIIRKAGLNPVLNWAGTAADDITSYSDDLAEEKPKKAKKKKKKNTKKKKTTKKKSGSNIGAPRPW